MPPRRRRDGYRAGELSPRLRDAIAAEAEALAEIEGPVAMVEAVGNVFAALDDALEAISLVRLHAVVALRRDGWSYARIAAATGLTKQRVGQLVHEAAARGLLR